MATDELYFDTSGWTRVTLPDGHVAFTRDPDDQLIAHAFTIPPDIGASLADLTAIRQRYRQELAARGAAMISLEPVEVDGVPSLELILKSPQEPSGMTYVGALTIPFRDSSFVLKVQCHEVGVTGTRDAIVLNDVLKTVGGDLHRAMEIWGRDPYDVSFRAPLLRNQADDEAYDDDFPGHPLSRVRRHLRTLRTQTAFSDDVKRRAPYLG